ncbi:hypothetical protein H5410_031634 [Solanum commersonii]|uniref:Ubiquitin-like protease family profile domain-containing protein n=1 Tax=Solanum commersonii TaxID=4109 RepID=A0A9J5YKQ0_SOLCO|nr:hypothetical protein H5410_031634 [Solanum commersonii]
MRRRKEEEGKEVINGETERKKTKRFTRGIPLHVENNVEHPSFSLGLTQDFGEIPAKKRKDKTDPNTDHNDKIEVIVSRPLEHDKHIDVILYYIRKRAKYSDTNAFSFITVDCNFNNLITNVWDAYYNFESNINKGSTEESIIEYINGYRMHVARPWHTIDYILIPVNVKEIFHWILIVVSINDRSIQILLSLDF